jgi:hypothetical protein
LQGYFFVMKTTFTFVAWVVALAGSVAAAPVTFKEISLLVRMHDTDAYITQQLAQRRLLHALTPAQETALRAEGASDTLLQALHKPGVAFSPEEAAAFEKWREEQRQALERKTAEDAAQHKAMLARQALAAQQLEQTRARAAAEAAAANSSRADDYGYRPYYGGYYGGSIGLRPGRTNCPPSFPASGLYWKDGSATTFTTPGLHYYPLGTNGSRPIAAPSAPSHPVGAIAGRGVGGGGVRSGR